MNIKSIKTESRKNGTESFAQQSAICSLTLNVNDLYVAYAYNHDAMAFQDVVISQGLNATMREATLLVDLHTTVFGSQSLKVARVVSDYDNGFITFKEKETELENLLFPEAFDCWDEPFRIWSNADAGISIGAAPFEELLSVLPNDKLTMLMQGITEELKERKNA